VSSSQFLGYQLAAHLDATATDHGPGRPFRKRSRVTVTPIAEGTVRIPCGCREVAMHDAADPSTDSEHCHPRGWTCKVPDFATLHPELNGVWAYCCRRRRHTTSLVARPRPAWLCRCSCSPSAASRNTSGGTSYVCRCLFPVSSKRMGRDSNPWYPVKGTAVFKTARPPKGPTPRDSPCPLLRVFIMARYKREYKPLYRPG
jgi:hypothetical protein